MAPKHPMATNKSSQRGAILIVALVLLAVMTTLGFTSLRSTNIQQAIINNSQFLASARNVALTEINAHIDSINIGNPSDRDQVLLDILDSGGTIIIADSINSDEATGLNAPQTAYSQSFTATVDCDDCPAPPGFSLEGGSGFDTARITLQSRAELDATSAASTQYQGYYYVKPSGSN
jgi:type II secretory pathway pseudopilin PulG